MVTENMVSSLPKVIPLDGVCKGCVLEKHHQASFDSGNVQCASNPLELVHGDLCCVNKPLLVGERYVLTNIDDVSYYTWVYFL